MTTGAKTILRLFIASLIVGALLYALHIDPIDIYDWLFHHILKFTGKIWHWMSEKGFQYFLLGAAVILPFYGLSLLLRFLRQLFKGRS